MLKIGCQAKADRLQPGQSGLQPIGFKLLFIENVIVTAPSEIHISAAELKTASLSEWERLELHLLDQAAVLIPGVMNVMEVIRTAEALQGLASDLLTATGTACEKCVECGVELLCG